MAFDSLGLDLRILRALGKRGFETPTPVQTEAIPKALEGRDIVARARTGSGKTLAYLLPALHRILANTTTPKAGWQALLLVPTRELCEQVKDEAAALAQHLNAEVTVTAIAGDTAPRASTAASAGQLVVSTPARIATLLREGGLTQQTLDTNLRTLVLDEADLLLSYGYEDDIKEIAPRIPRACQCMLMSATTSDDLDRLTKLVLHNPIALDLLAATGSEGKNGQEDGENGGEGGCGTAEEITHYRVDLPSSCSSGGLVTETTEKLLHVLVLVRLGLVPRKVLIFVNSVEVGMKVRLFLEAFGTRCSVLSAELPLNTRHHILQEFNKGLFDYLIATDDVHAADLPTTINKTHMNTTKKQQQPKGGKKKGNKKDEEFGVTRGIDFKGVGTVINFECPDTIKGYVHRVGRTGRAGQAGMAVTLLAPSDAGFAAQLQHALKTTTATTTTTNPTTLQPTTTSDGDNDSENSDSEEDDDTNNNTALKPFEKLTKAAIEGLRYRAEDVSRSITKNVVKEARTKDLKAELLNSKRLASFFEDRPADLQLLRHDRPLAASASAAAAPHLKHLPAYLRDTSLQGKSFVGNSGRAPLPVRKRRKTEGIDPVKGFVRAPKKGGDRLEEPTEMEVRAEEKAKKERKKKAKSDRLTGFKPKSNVRKNKGRKR